MTDNFILKYSEAEGFEIEKYETKGTDFNHLIPDFTDIPSEEAIQQLKGYLGDAIMDTGLCLDFNKLRVKTEAVNKNPFVTYSERPPLLDAKSAQQFIIELMSLVKEDTSVLRVEGVTDSNIDVLPAILDNLPKQITELNLTLTALAHINQAKLISLKHSNVHRLALGMLDGYTINNITNLADHLPEKLKDLWLVDDKSDLTRELANSVNEKIPTVNISYYDINDDYSDEEYYSVDESSSDEQQDGYDPIPLETARLKKNLDDYEFDSSVDENSSDEQEAESDPIPLETGRLKENLDGYEVDSSVDENSSDEQEDRFDPILLEIGRLKENLDDYEFDSSVDENFSGEEYFTYESEDSTDQVGYDDHKNANVPTISSSFLLGFFQGTAKHTTITLISLAVASIVGVGVGLGVSTLAPPGVGVAAGVGAGIFAAGATATFLYGFFSSSKPKSEIEDKESLVSNRL